MKYIIGTCVGVIVAILLYFVYLAKTPKEELLPHIDGVRIPKQTGSLDWFKEIEINAIRTAGELKNKRMVLRHTVETSDKIILQFDINTLYRKCTALVAVHNSQREKDNIQIQPLPETMCD